MKVTMINDCASVGETLLKYLPADLQKEHLKRSRNAWSKTFGISWQILRANADVYHAHYLLQDCYIANRLGKKPLIGHAHGSDLRVSMQHWMWGRMVRHNLKSCDRVLVSTPDVLGRARSVRGDAEYLPNPVDRELFYPRTVRPNEGKIRVLIASDCNWSVKGTDIAVKALGKIKEEVEVSVINQGLDFQKTLDLASSLGLHLNILSKLPHGQMNQYYWNADLVIDRFTLGSLGMVALEAIACGRPVITYVSSEYPQTLEFPLKDLKNEEEIAQVIRNLPTRLWEEEHSFLRKYHDIDIVESKLLSIYRELL